MSEKSKQYLDEFFNLGGMKIEDYAKMGTSNKTDENIKKLKKQALELRNAIKRNQKEIDNPALINSVISELDFFIEGLEEDE